MKEIILLGSENQNSLEKKYLKAFKELKIKKICLINLDKNFPSILKFKYINKIFLYFRILYNSLYFLIYFLYQKNKIIIIFKGQFFLPFILNFIKIRNSNLLININGDDPFNCTLIDISTQNLISSLSCYDFIFIWSKEIKKKLDDMNLPGKIYYLPFAYDKLANLKKNYLKRNKVIFYGSWDKDREVFLNRIKINNLFIYGNGWEKSSKFFFHKNRIFAKDINKEKIMKIFRSSYAVINHFRKQNLNSHNMKTFEIPAYGGIQFSLPSKELNLFFKKNKTIFIYRNYSDLKIKLIKIKKKNLNRIIKYTFKIIKQHSYKNRAKEILRYVKG